MNLIIQGNKIEVNYINRISDEELRIFKNDTIIPLFVERYHGFLLSLRDKNVNGIIINST